MQINLDSQFQAMDVTRICGVKRNRLQAWMEQGWITPSIQKATGHGTRNIFSIEDLYSISLFKQMVESGISRAAVAEFIPEVDSFLLGVRIKGMKVFSEEQASFNKSRSVACAFFRKEGNVLSSHMLSEGQSIVGMPDFAAAADVIVINLQRIVRMVDKKLLT
jgi:DNA-binding transcriptional MerR regulator